MHLFVCLFLIIFFLTLGSILLSAMISIDLNFEKKTIFIIVGWQILVSFKDLQFNLHVRYLNKA